LLSMQMPNSNVPLEKRSNTRQPALMKGQIVVPNGAPVSCSVRDVSRHGAKIGLPKEWVMPKIFWLRIVGEPGLRHCTVLWRNGQYIGVIFSDDEVAGKWPLEKTNHSPAKKPRARR
jgi:hypothetical protein